MASVPNLLLLLFFLSYRSPIAHAGDDGSSRVVLSIDSLRTQSVCFESKASSPAGAVTVPLHHRHGPCSPLPTKNMPSLEQTLHRDQLRAAFIRRKLSTTVPTTLGTSLDTLEYVITVRLGSPAKPQTMLIDTGSDVPWVQCKPCSQCHSQVDPLFDPTSSRTYAPFSCASAACTQLGGQQEQAGNCSAATSQQCQYIVRYGFDGSTSTTGTYGSDTLALGTSSHAAVVRKFQFGCSHVETGFILNDQTAGIMGLGGGAQSLVAQTAGTFGTAFSYCLPPTPSSPGFLRLGAAGASSSGGFGFVRTPMLRSRAVPTFYGVQLQAIRVGGRQLVGVPATVFAAGAIMDSGTIFTRLPPTAYAALSAAFRAGMQQYPPAPPNGILDTCFDFTGLSSVSIPTVALVFSGGAVVNLDASGIIFGNCLAFAANDDGTDTSPGIIGNVQQRTFEVLYDVGLGAVGFKARAC